MEIKIINTLESIFGLIMTLMVITKFLIMSLMISI